MTTMYGIVDVAYRLHSSALRQTKPLTLQMHFHVSGTQANGPSDVNVPYVRLSRWPDTTFT